MQETSFWYDIDIDVIYEAFVCIRGKHLDSHLG